MELLACPVRPVQRGKCRLAGGGVLLRRLAHLGGVGRQVEQIVGKLEGKADRRAEFGQPFAVGGRRAGNDRASLAGEADERAGLHRLQPDDACFVRPLALGFEVEGLAADHAAGAGGAGKRQHEGRAAFGRQHRRVVGDNVEGERQQRVAGKDRGRFVEGLVHRRLAATQVVVVHRRQVVMDQRIAVHAFERRRDAKRRLAAGGKKGGTFQDQKRAEPLAAVQHAMAHGRHQAFRPRDFARQRARVEDLPQQRLDCGGAREKRGFEGHPVVFHHRRTGSRHSDIAQEALRLYAVWTGGTGAAA